ncbi:hypothetical protein M413DRAFT_203701 [Hebeloma cylindrosporum]|uniref:Het-C-domain-containing protein n=1 Tax=Hebeloma cylindrosporum TaxID=76867 RepID=A0A0C2YCQ4_HEBCY|nr:hypothetical protein M413DRAFT_203701 [Hebeloma cylindrosporum h7]
MAPTALANTFLLLTILVVLLPVETYAFGAGDIPDFAYLNDKAFRHGDIESILETLVKSAGGAAIGGSAHGILGFASSVIKHVSGGSKFSKSDIKKVYFGNWLRDYSQAMDIAGLSKLSADTLVLVVAVLGFMTFGFATEEFEITADRLGVYLPVEHIDNPKGYAEKEGDARLFHPKLRPPVSPRELEIDERTGMKKYIATENQGWDTSTAFIRRTFRACIEAGRRAGGREGAELWEAYRLLGTGLHTMEDLLAHSNWCEIALRKMGHKEVFCHVGDRVTVNTPNGPAPPLVTGTFGSADFMHSLLGEAGDKLSQASVTDLSDKMNNPQGGKKIDISALKAILSKFGGGNDEKLKKGEQIQQQSQAYNFDPNNIAPPEVQKQLLDLLRWHDDIMRDIIKKMEMVPGLTTLLDEVSNALNEYIYTILAPYLGPILSQTTSVIDEGSKVVIDSDDQYEVFDNPNAHDPSHSLLSKDHFGLILNEPAGKIAQIIVENSVNLIVRAWSDNSNPDDVITQVLEAFHHPYYNTGRSEIQNKMFDHMQRWIGSLGSEAQEIIRSLTKESVRNHKNKRPGLDDTPEAGYGGCGHGGPKKSSQKISGAVAGGYASKPPQSYGRDDNIGSQTGYSSAQKTSGYGAPQTQYSGNTYASSDSSNTYGQGHTGVGHAAQRRDDDDNRPYSSQKKQGDDSSYGGGGYGGHDDNYGRKRPEEGYGGGGYGHDSSSGYGSQRRDDNSAYGGGGFGGQGAAYGGQRPDDNSRYGGQKRQDDVDDNRNSGRPYGGQGQTSFGTQTGGYNTSYGQPDKPSYGGNNYGRDDDDRGKKSRRGDDDDDDKKYKPAQPSYGGGYGGGYGGNDYSGKSRKDKDDSDDDKKRRSSQTGYGGGYGGGNDKTSYGRSRKDDSDDDKKKFKSNQPSYGGGRKDKDDSDDDSRRRSGRKHDNDDNRSYGQPAQAAYGQSGYGQSGGYAPSYGRDDTFGVERMNIRGGGRGRDEDSDDDRKKHHKHQERY